MKTSHRILLIMFLILIFENYEFKGKAFLKKLFGRRLRGGQNNQKRTDKNTQREGADKLGRKLNNMGNNAGNGPDENGMYPGDDLVVDLKSTTPHEEKGPIYYNIDPRYYSRFENWEGFNRWFIDMWRGNRFTHEYDYGAIDTNYFVGDPDTVGDPNLTDQEAVDAQNFEQHFAHLQKVLKEEKSDQDFVMSYSKERSAEERMIKFRESRNRIYESILLMEKVLYSEQDQLVENLQRNYTQFNSAKIAEIDTNMKNLVKVPHYPLFPSALDIFVE